MRALGADKRGAILIQKVGYQSKGRDEKESGKGDAVEDAKDDDAAEDGGRQERGMIL